MKSQLRHMVIRGLSAALMLSAVLLLLAGCGPSRVTKEIEATGTGIDVARYQGTIDWQQVAENGVDFAMVRIGYRTLRDGVIEADSNGRYNLQEAARAGIPVGVYFFSTAVSGEEAREEAEWVADQIARYPITYPVVYDCEGFRDPESRQYGMTKEERTDAALVFLKTIKKLGYEPMFYGSKNELEMFWEMERIEKHYKVWVAQYPAQPYPETAQSSYEGKHQMWQYTKEGALPGIETDVDLNLCYFGYDGIEPAKDPEPPEEARPDPEALMRFSPASDQVTAKVETNLRDMPSQDEDSQVLYTLKHGEIADRIGVSDSGWSKLSFQGQTYYAVTSYLTTDLNGENQSAAPDSDGDGIETQFTPCNQQVTAKKLVNLRKLPSVEREDATVIAELKHGDVATCIGTSDNGWSKLQYNGETCYAVSSYLMPAEGGVQETKPAGEIQTKFEECNDLVTAKLEVNLRTMPSVEDPNCVVVASIKNGEVVTRTGINRDVGWSRVEYNGQTLYCVTQYLTGAE